MVSPYLERPLRSLAEAIADIELARHRALQGRAEALSPAPMSASAKQEESKDVTY